MEIGSPFMFVLLVRVRTRTAKQDLDGDRLCDAGSLRCPGARYIDSTRCVIKLSIR